MLKRSLALILCLCMLMCLFSGGIVSAESDTVKYSAKELIQKSGDKDKNDINSNSKLSKKKIIIIAIVVVIVAGIIGIFLRGLYQVNWSMDKFGKILSNKSLKFNL